MYIIWLYITIYLCGRLLFYEINTIINVNHHKSRRIYIRLIWGFLFILMTADTGTMIVLTAAHSLAVLFDTLVLPGTVSRARPVYFIHMLINIIIMPALLYMLHRYILIWPNPLLALWQLFSTDKAGSGLLQKAGIIFTGYILTVKEGTIFIRLILNRISAVPENEESLNTAGGNEYERGRLIGILERTFIYFLILFNQIGGIAVIIALKSLARFNKLNDKNFAEYFLIGSFLSLLAAAVPAIVVRIILNSI